MTDTTLRLDLPLLAAAQAQKHVTHNEALVALDALVHLSVIDRRAVPPSAPLEGDRHLVDTSPSGVWTGQAGRVALFQDGGWRFLSPRAGCVAWVAADDVPLVHDGSTWTDLKARAADMFGINTAADAGNRLAVSSPAALFTHEGTDSRVKVNKAATADTASLLFQTAYSGRAEMGLAGSDAFQVKVSADGATWRAAMMVDPTTGYVGMGTATPLSRIEVRGLLANDAQIKVLREQTIANGGGGMVMHHVNAGGGLPVAGDRLGYVLFGTTSAGANFQGGGLVARAEADYSTSSLPTYFAIETAPAGSTARAERMRITSDGKIGVNTTSPTCAMDIAGPVRVGQYAKTALPSAASSGAGAVIYVNDETGGAVLAFSDGIDWRRVTDRAVVS